MAETQTEQQSKTSKLKEWFKDTAFWAGRRGMDTVWNRLQRRKFTPEARDKGKKLQFPFREEFKDYFEENKKRLNRLHEIEERWAALEASKDINFVFPYQGPPTLKNLIYAKDPDVNALAITEIYRALEHYRDMKVLMEELQTFDHDGTIELDIDAAREYTPDEIAVLKQKARAQLLELQQLPSIRTLTDEEEQQRVKDIAFTTDSLKKLESGQLSFPSLPMLIVGSKELPFALNGRPEQITAFGYLKIKEFKDAFSDFNDELNTYGSLAGASGATRNQIGVLLGQVLKVFEKFETIEHDHHEKLNTQIKGLLQRAIDNAEKVGTDLRPEKNEIRFAHTYKIIRQFITVEIDDPQYKIVEHPVEIYKITPIIENSRIKYKKVLKTAYFNPNRNPYKDEMAEIKQKLDNHPFTMQDEKNNKAIFGANNTKILIIGEQIKNIEKKLEKIPKVIESFYIIVAGKIIKSLKDFINNSTASDLEKVTGKDSVDNPDFKEGLKEIIQKIYSSSGKTEDHDKSYKEFIELIEEAIPSIPRVKVASKASLKFTQESIRRLNKAIVQENQRIDNLKLPLLKELNHLRRGIETVKETIREKRELQLRRVQLNYYLRHPLLKPNHSYLPAAPFVKAPDEKDYGLDENGWALEVEKVNDLTELRQVGDNDNGFWIVLLDKWWTEIKQNRWQKAKIKTKPGGKRVIQEKITQGINHHHIRVVDPRFVDDLDPLDKIMFIENEWDSYRDDYRDGRYHPNSKSIMDYLLASKQGIIPTKHIHLQGNNEIKKEDVQNRIHYVPLYNKRGNVRISSISNHEIPEDERAVTRVYEVKVQKTETEEETLSGQIRKPNPFNPAFDRAALGTGFLHWGRMYYYEPVEGINRWSENPYPHITTRGIAKYLIDLAIRRTFSYEEARESLRGDEIEWDYGIRHYDPPFITDPLGPASGPGGALSGWGKQ